MGCRVPGGGDWGLACAIRVFSKKLLRRRGVLFGGVWGAVGTARGDGAAGWRLDRKTLVPGSRPGQAPTLSHRARGQEAGRLSAGRRGWLVGVGRKARGRSANVGRRGTNGGGGRASGERRAAIGGGRSRTGNRPRTDGIKLRRRLSGRSRSEGVGIWRLGCGVYPGSVHFEYGECKAKESLGQGLVGELGLVAFEAGAGVEV